MTNWNDARGWTRRDLLQTAAWTAGAATLGTVWRPSALRAATPRPGGVLKISVNHRAQSLNPMKQINNTGFLLGEMMYSAVTRIDEKMQAIPDLAESWQPNADATEFVFTVRQGVKFHHGPEVTAEDCAASIRAVLDPKTASSARNAIGPIAGVEAIDRYRFKVTLKGPYADLPVALAAPAMRVVPAAMINEEGLKKIDVGSYGSGPFKATEADLGRKITLVKNPDYYVKGLPYLDGVEMILYPDLAAERSALVNGETHVMLSVPASDYADIAKSKGVVGRRQETGRFLNVVMRWDQKPFDDLRVRQALRLSIDREALIDLVQETYGRVAYDNLISPEYPYYKEFSKPKRDIAEAKKLLAAAGHGGGLKFTMYAANRPPERIKLAVAMKEMARQAGFDIDVQTVAYDQYIANVWRKAACYVASWNMTPTEDQMFTRLLTSDAAWEDTGWKNKEFDDAVAEARRTVDPAKRGALYAKAQMLTDRDIPYLVPFYQDILSAHREQVMDFTMHPLQYPHFLDKAWLAEKT